jgi:hypothetical protein
MNVRKGFAMARMNTTQLIHHATNLGYRAKEAQKDPAAQKAWSEAGRDVARAAKSLAAAGVETRAAWRRAGTGGGARFAGQLA